MMSNGVFLTAVSAVLAILLYLFAGMSDHIECDNGNPKGLIFSSVLPWIDLDLTDFTRDFKES